MTERDILINNIVLSEIGFIRKLETLGKKISGEHQENIAESMAHDHKIIEYWCITYGITRDDLIERRKEILEDEHYNAEDMLKDAIHKRKTVKDDNFEIQMKIRKDYSNMVKRIRIENKDTHRIIDTLINSDLLWQSIPLTLHDYSPQEQRGLVE